MTPDNTNYNPNQPVRTDSLDTSQPSFLVNFQQIFNAFAQNHVSLDAGATAGNHTIVQLLEQAESFQTDISEISVYVKKVADQTDQVFLRYQGNGQEIQFTNYQLYSISSNSVQTAYFTFLPGGIILYFGLVTPQNNTQQLISLTPPIAKNIICVDITPQSPGILPFPAKPYVTYQQAENGLYNGVFMNGNATQTILTTSFYLVMANVV